jgi:glutamate dehydrogenase
MTTAHTRGKEAAITRLFDLLAARLSAEEAGRITHFARQFYARCAPEDVLSVELEDLYGGLLSQWHLMGHRKPGVTLVHTYNPSAEEHGWQSPHTVIEIITDDMPFLVDSLSINLVRQGITIHTVLHPVIKVRRDASGRLIEVLAPEDGAEGALYEAALHFEVDRQTEPQVLATLSTDLHHTLADVRLVVEDWQPMRAKMKEIIDILGAQQLPVSAEEKEEALTFLRWLEDNHFTFIGFRAYDLVEEDGQDTLQLGTDSGLGIFRDTEAGHISESFAHIPPPMRRAAHTPTLLIITKSTAQSPVHRPEHMDYLGIKRFNDAGDVIGEWRFLGLYGSTVYNTLLTEIPILRRKVARLVRRAGYSPASHSGKALQHILTTLPRDELFQIDEDVLFDITTGILQVQERHKLRLFISYDPFARFVSTFVYVPRDHYNTELRLRMEQILLQALNGQSAEFDVQFSASVLARVHFIIRTQPGEIPETDVSELEAQLSEAMLSWSDKLHIALREHYGEGIGIQLARKYAHAFPAAYRDDFPPRTAVLDIQHLEETTEVESLTTHLYRPLEGSDELLRFKVYGRNQSMALSDVLPMLERMGLRVLEARPYEIESGDGSRFWILDFDMAPGHGIEVEVLEVKQIFQDAFARVCGGEIENDSFNRLVLAACLEWRHVMVLRAICKYLLQTQAPFSQSYMAHTLTNNPRIAALLAQLFLARFDPSPQQDAVKASEKLTARIEHALEAVANLDQDRILRRYLAVIQAMLRTNYFQRDAEGAPKSYLAFKLDPAKVPDLPLPRPMFEIFVYSPSVEGVHLRGGPVARGGLRWSDRREDFRTEILGLMKAQMVKNAVIVPVGAKGGFVAKRLPNTKNRDAIHNEVVRCYRCFVSGLLDLTDNLVDGKVIIPQDVVRYDGDDTYLVVAADKGTAAFSDIANEIAGQYNFWLGDGFASGGSSGYDHKKMAITARGGWESVKCLFRELDIDCQNQDFTAAGIGDMSGDVFGNGMLQSRHIRLVAAFNHQHIFLDPNPDPARSFLERQRLFDLPRSAWTDYADELISPGGGVYSRSAKSIHLSTEARECLDIDSERLTPDELIRAILRAPVDLLWNGGIGTYVKASSEQHGDAGDRTNDAVRINGSALQCKIVGEGGNLGFTQLGRVEYARNGGLINTDFIDNSGGVDCSDHEVNIKILLRQIMQAGDMTLKQRNQMLYAMTDEVAALVLQHNYLQSLALSIATTQAALLPNEHIQLMHTLERDQLLKRKLEFLPDDQTLTERGVAGEGLSRPEIAVLLAYSKLQLFKELCGSELSEDRYLANSLVEYFPTAMRDTFADRMQSHPLKKEIIATQITNSLINRMGCTFVLRMQDETGEDATDIARAYTAAKEIFTARQLWSDISALDGVVPTSVSLSMLIEIRRLLDRATLWLMRNRRPPLDIATVIDQFTGSVEIVIKRIPRLLQGETREAYRQANRRFTKAGIPKELAHRIATLEFSYPALDLVEISFELDMNVEEVTDVYFKLGFALELFWLRDQIQALPRTNYWQRKARLALRYDLYMELRALTKETLEQTRSIRGAEARVFHWLEHNRVAVSHCQNMLADIRATTSHDLAMLSVAMREIRSLMGRGENED